mgnify:FL=1
MTTTLRAANNSHIPVFGKRICKFTLDPFKKQFLWQFTVADVSQPILWAHFFAAHSILINCKNQKLFQRYEDILDHNHSLKFHGNIITSVHHSNLQHQIYKLFHHFKETGNQLLNKKISQSKTFHHIPVRLQLPCRARPRELAPERLTIAKKEFFELERAGVIRRSSSPWASPLHMVAKKTVLGDHVVITVP